MSEEPKMDALDMKQLDAVSGGGGGGNGPEQTRQDTCDHSEFVLLGERETINGVLYEFVKCTRCHATMWVPQSSLFSSATEEPLFAPAKNK